MTLSFLSKFTNRNSVTFSTGNACFFIKLNIKCSQQWKILKMAISFGVSTFIKLGIGSVLVLLSVDLMFIVYERQKKRLHQREIKEVCFLMSNRLPCCHHSNYVDSQLINCKNDHCKGKLSNKIIQHIESAKHLICIAMYMNSMNQITSAIMRAHKRGVTIRIIADKSMIGSTNSKINELQREGIAVRICGDGEKYMHHKFCLIDVLYNEKNPEMNEHTTGGLIINGSLNWTANGFMRNWENVTFQSDDYIKNEFKKGFDYIWRRLVPRIQDTGS